MRVLIACEFSGRVREAFRKLGHDAWSCDIEPAEDGSKHHIQGDVLGHLREGWDQMIAHPPCTHLAISGARHFTAKQADGRQQEAIEFFMSLVNAPIKRKAVENPVCIMSTYYRKPDQIIQPHQFGHPEFKATCLWLEELPLLVPTAQVENVPPRGSKAAKAWDVVHRMAPGPKRANARSRTYLGVAEAMAAQWGIL